MTTTEYTRAGEIFEGDLKRELADPQARALFERELAKANAIGALLQLMEEARERQELSKAEVARRVGSERSATSRLLAGKSVNPTFSTIADLADALGLEIELRVKQRPVRSKRPHTPVRVLQAA